MEDSNLTTTPTVEAKQETAPPKTEGAREGEVKSTGAESTPEAKTTTPTPKTYTEEELAQRVATVKGGHEGTVKKLKGDIAKLQERYDATTAQLEELQQASFLRGIENAGGDVDLAKTLLAREKQVKSREAELARIAEALESSKAELSEAGRGYAALKLVKEYGLDEKAIDELVKAEDGVQMENMALKLFIKKGKTEQKPAAKVDTGQTQPKGVDYSKMSLVERFGRAWDEGK